MSYPFRGSVSILSALVLVAVAGCGGSNSSTTATPTMTAGPSAATPPPSASGAFVRAAQARVPALQGFIWQRGSANLLAFSRTEAQLIDALNGNQQSVLSVAAPEAVAAVSNTGFVATVNGNVVTVTNVRIKLAPKVIIATSPFSAAVLSTDGSLLALTQGDRIAAELWDVEEQEEIKELAGFQTAAPVYSVRFGPGGRSLIWLSRARVQVMDIASRTLSPTMDHEDFIGGFALSEDRATLVTSAGTKVSIWDVASGRSRATLPQTDSVSDLALAPDNETLAVATSQGVRLWDLKTQKEIGLLAGPARQVAFNEDGRQLAASDDSGTLTLWRRP